MVQNIELSMEVIVQAAEEVGFVRTASCCAQPLKFCNGDEWEGNLEGFAKALLRLAAAAPSPAVAVPVSQNKRKVFMDEIDAATAGSEWLEPFFSPGFRLCYSVDEGSQAPRAKWCMLFDSLDRVVAGYMLTRDAKNWTELTKVGPHAPSPSPSLAVRDVVEVSDDQIIKRAGEIFGFKPHDQDAASRQRMLDFARWCADPK